MEQRPEGGALRPIDPAKIREVEAYLREGFAGEVTALSARNDIVQRFRVVEEGKEYHLEIWRQVFDDTPINQLRGYLARHKIVEGLRKVWPRRVVVEDVRGGIHDGPEPPTSSREEMTRRQREGQAEEED